MKEHVEFDLNEEQTAAIQFLLDKAAAAYNSGYKGIVIAQIIGYEGGGSFVKAAFLNADMSERVVNIISPDPKMKTGNQRSIDL